MHEITLRKIRNILPELVLAQIPRTVRERGIGIKIECDSALMKVYAILTLNDRRDPRVWKFELQDGVFEGRRTPTRLRDEDVSLLCVSV